MPYANTGGGSRQSLTPAQAAGKKRKDAARMEGKSIHWMNKQAKLKRDFDAGYNNSKNTA